MKRKISFGKIDGYGNGEKTCEVTIEISLDENDPKKPKFSVRGNVWNDRGTDIIMCGQCLDNLLPYFKGDKLFVEIYRLWKNYHLNDLKPGTPEQMKCIEAHKAEIDENDGWYHKELNLLKKYDLDVVLVDGEPYKYGSGLIYSQIPQKDLETIKKIIADGVLPF